MASNSAGPFPGINAISIVNDGPYVEATNYWRSSLAARGAMYASWSAATLRLLIPPALEDIPAEWESAEYVIASRGTWHIPPAPVGDGTRRLIHPQDDSLELLFEDHSSDPYSIHMVRQQFDRLASRADEGRTDLRFLAYIEGSRDPVMDLPARYRRVSRLPYLRPWR